MPMTDFFLDYVPMYAKFRTVASILVIAEFTIPLLAMMAVKECLSTLNNSDTPGVPKKLLKYIGVSFLLTAGIAAVFAMMPGLFFDYISVAERQAVSQIPADQLTPLMADIIKVRHIIFSADCWRSVLIITVGTVLMILALRKKMKTDYAIAAMTVLCLVDMWQVDKRYLNDGMFVPKSEREAPQQMTATDEQILKDKTLDYRVLNLASNTFNENETSYYHKSVGGYHAAKLRRYQELIERYISPEMRKTMPTLAAAGGNMNEVKGDSIFPVLNMLNTRYFIMPLQGGQTMPLQNPYAFGNAWFVDKLTFVDNANQELDKVGQINLRHEAVSSLRWNVEGCANNQDVSNNSGTVTLTSYEPNELTYDVSSQKGGIIVFSEIYYPGWTATVDGQETEIGRVDYVLRALAVKAGSHKVVLTFKPKSIAVTEAIAYTALALLVIAVLAIIILRVRKTNIGK